MSANSDNPGPGGSGSHPPLPMAAADVAEAARTGTVCSICQTGVIAGEELVSCPRCAIPLHAECWSENGGCSQYGCEAAPPTIKATAVADPTASWEGDKTCPACGRKIKARALKCRHCLETFEVRAPMSRSQYAAREYVGEEYTSARNQVVGLFLVSATGCLSPLAVIVSGILLWNRKLGRLEYMRLPPALRAMVQFAFAVNCLLLAAMVFFAVLD